MVPPLSTIQECKDMLGVGCTGPDGWAPSPNPDSPSDLEQTSLFSQTLPFPTCTMGPWHRGAPCDIDESCISDCGILRSQSSDFRLLKFYNIISVLPRGMSPADISLPCKLLCLPIPAASSPSLPSPHQLWAQPASNTSQVSTWQAGAVIHAPPAGFVASLPARVCKTFLALPCARD